MKQTMQQKPQQELETARPNLTGIPTQMKQDFEARSGLSFDDVRVHYNSDKPAQLQALAYTQGTQVHVGPGQERHLPHELGHVIQQKSGVVRPTRHQNGVEINDDMTLEKQADVAQKCINLKSSMDTCKINLIQMKEGDIHRGWIRFDNGINYVSVFEIGKDKPERFTIPKDMQFNNTCEMVTFIEGEENTVLKFIIDKAAEPQPILYSAKFDPLSVVTWIETQEDLFKHENVKSYFKTFKDIVKYIVKECDSVTPCLQKNGSNQYYLLVGNGASSKNWKYGNISFSESNRVVTVYHLHGFEKDSTSMG